MAIEAPCIGSNIQIDCGSAESSPWAAEEYLRLGERAKNADAFFLSHFHYDHYNGLIWLAEQTVKARVPILTAYYPRIPNVSMHPELRIEIIRCMVAFACYEASQPSRLLLGDNRRLVQRHFADTIRQVSGCPRGVLGVSQGDTIRGANGAWSVLWPPREVRLDSPYGQVMNNGVDAFSAAAEEDKRLREAFNLTLEAGVAEEYNATIENSDRYVTDDHIFTYDQRRDNDEGDANLASESDRETEEEIEGRELDEEQQTPLVSTANQALRRVADVFSLSFHSEPHVLFLGDLKSREIRQVVSLCSSRGNLHYHVLISSHHGTRWNPSLQIVSVDGAVVSSVGGKLRDLVRKEYNGFGVPHYLTCKDGHLALHA